MLLLSGVGGAQFRQPAVDALDAIFDLGIAGDGLLHGAGAGIIPVADGGGKCAILYGNVIRLQQGKTTF